MKKRYTRKQIVEAINYWKKQIRLGNYKRLNESVDQSYTGKTIGYKWLYCIESNISENQAIYSFDSESEAMALALKHIKMDFEDNDHPYYLDPNTGDEYLGYEQVVNAFRKLKCLEESGSGYGNTISIKRIRASAMPKLIELIQSKVNEYREYLESFDFDGNNVKVEGLYGFSKTDWEQILDMMA